MVANPQFGRRLAVVWPRFGRGLAAALLLLFFYPIKLQAAFEAAAGLVSLLHCLNLSQREPIRGKDGIKSSFYWTTEPKGKMAFRSP